MGGKQALASGLDRMLEMPPLFDESYYGFVVHEIREMQVMNMGNYAHGNQPVQHALYLYDWCGQPWKTQAMTRRLLKEMYQPTPEGICGNEDCGQMSAWYLLTSLGFYSVNPASCQYVLTTPLFEKATITLANGKQLTVIGGDAKATPYIAKVELNG